MLLVPIDIVVDALHKEFKIETLRLPAQPVKMVAYAKYSSERRTPVNTISLLSEKFGNFGVQEGRQALVSFSPPEGGMFVWVRFPPSLRLFMC